MKSRTHTILSVMNVLAWISFIGLMIKAGAMIFSFVISLWVKAASSNFYEGMNISKVQDLGILPYILLVGLLIAVPVIEAYIALYVIKILSKIKLESPFVKEVSEKLETLSHLILGLWFVALGYNLYSSWLMKRLSGLDLEKINLEFLFLAGVVFILAQVFKRGVELQSDNEYTV